MLADNDPDALELLELDLRLEGHQIVGLASDGDGAVRVSAETRPDVLVVDYRMPPGIDGVEAARRVLAAGSAGHVLLYSNYVDPDVVASAEALGATCLRKGDLATLRAAVARAGHGSPASAG